MTQQVTLRTDPNRFEITEDAAVAGATRFEDEDGHRIFYHTEVSPAFRHQGIAGQLIGKALAETRDAGLRIVALCPFVAHYVESHPEWNDQLDPVTPEIKEQFASWGY